MDDGIIQVDGDRLVLPDGSPIVLRGVGLGGWMNMENFITGYPGAEFQAKVPTRPSALIPRVSSTPPSRRVRSAHSA